MANDVLTCVDQLFLPGEIVRDLKDIDEQENKIVLEPGFRVQEKQVLLTKPGILHFKQYITYWIDCH
uniref:Uncharacterized protein n=1 Tax=Octopus bimaculoides TaxID=37653 RepID=A0A0L8ICK9_OCTBM